MIPTFGIALLASTAAPVSGAAVAPHRSPVSCEGNAVPTEIKDAQTVIRHSGDKGDPATVIRRGPEGEIILEQSGPCNDAAIALTGADNRAVVRQSGSGNTVVVRQGGKP